MKLFRKAVAPNWQFVAFRILLGTLVVAAVVAPLLAQTTSQGTKSSTPAGQLVGTWQAKLKGEPYFIVRIAAINPQIIGTMSVAHQISTGPNGEINEVHGAANLSDSHPMIEPKIEDNRLSFKFRTGDDDAAHPDTYEMALTSSDEALLSLTETFDNAEGRNLTAEEISTHLKPLHLQKVAIPSSRDQEFVGTWRAELKGRPYFILNIESVTPKIAGKFVAAPGLNVSPNGEVTNVWSDAKLTDAHALIEPRLEGDRLTFQYKFENDDPYADTFEMTLNGPDEATLRLTKTFDNQEQKFISEEEIAKAMKPSHLKKVQDPARK